MGRLLREYIPCINLLLKEVEAILNNNQHVSPKIPPNLIIVADISNLLNSYQANISLMKCYLLIIKALYFPVWFEHFHY